MEENNMKEVWKDVPSWESCYQASNYGRVRSKDRYVRTNRGSMRLVKGSIKSLYHNKDGYLSTHFRDYKTNRSATLLVHRIIAETFIKKIDGKNAIDHINGIRDDNRVVNLRWCTNKENSNFPLARKNGLEGQKLAYIKNPLLKKIKADNLRKLNATPINVYKNGVLYKSFNTQKEAENFLGLCQGMICKYLKGKVKNSTNYTFEYAYNL